MGKTVGLAVALLLALALPASAQMAKGNTVVVAYSAQGDKKIVTDLDRKTKLMDGTESTNLGAR